MVCGHQNLGRILYMSIILSIHFSLSASLNTIFPEMSDQKGYNNVGQMTIMVTYTMEVLGNIYGQNFISLKRSGLSFFFCGLIPVITFIPAIILNRCEDKIGICSYYSIVGLSCLGYAFQGLGLGTYFLVQNCYQSACSNVKSRDLLNGLSFTIIGMTFLIGNSYSAPLVEILGRERFFIVLAITQFIVNLFFLFLPNPQMESILKEPNHNQVNESLFNDDQNIITASSGDLASPLIVKQLGPLQAMIQQMRDPATQTLLPYFLLTGVLIGFEFGQFYQVISQCLPEGLDQVIVNQKTFVVFLFYGVGEITSGPIIVLLRGRIELSNYLRLYTYLTGFTLIITGVNLYVKSYEFCFAIALFWGIIDNFGQSTSNMIISSQWGDNFSLFALYLVLQNLGAVIYQIFVIFLSYSLIIYALSFIILIQIVALVSTQIFTTKFYIKHKVV